MSKATTTDRKASASEVRTHAEQVRRFAQEVGVSEPRLRADGTVVVHSASDRVWHETTVDLLRLLERVEKTQRIAGSGRRAHLYQRANPRLQRNRIPRA